MATSAAAAASGEGDSHIAAPPPPLPSSGAAAVSPSASAVSPRLTVVLKVGSASLSTPDGRFVHLSVLARLVELVCALMQEGHRVLLVTSGAVSIGCQRMQLRARPSSLIAKQAVAAVGQLRLMRLYDDLFSQLQQPVAQVLLSRENLSKRHHYTNALHTFTELLDMRVVPIVNENDTVAVEELRVGDNDTLSALVASLVQADFLFLLTDVPSLYTADPRKYPTTAQPIHLVTSVDALQVDVGAGAPSASSSSSTASSSPSGSSNEWGTGGMATKLQAARIASSAGCRCCIVHTAALLEHVPRMLQGDTSVGTTFLPLARPLRGSKRFIAHGLAPQGSVLLDAGATAAVLDKKSLFAAGVRGVEGDFPAQSSVRLIEAASGAELGRGVVNYSSREIRLLQGHKSSEMAELLHYSGADEVVHRDSLSITRHTQHTAAAAAPHPAPPHPTPAPAALHTAAAQQHDPSTSSI